MLLGMLFSISISMAQQVTVVDKTTKEPVEFVQIGSKGSTTMLITDAKGQVDITPFVGLSDIIFRLYGYEPKELDYSELKTKNFQIEMAASVFMMKEVVISANKSLVLAIA